MARKTIALAVTAVLAISTLALAGELLQTVTFDRKDVSFNRAGGYDRIDLAGVPAMGPVGAPRLPLLVQALAIPAGASISGVEIVSADEIELPGEYSVGPAQKAVPLPMPGRTFKTELMAPDAAIYQRDALYPAAVATALSTESLCGYRIGHVAVSPVRYNPVTKKLYFSQRITYRVRYQEGTGAAIATKDQQTVFGQQARLLVANPGDVERFAPQVRRSASKSLPAGEYRSVIISGSASFDTVFARLAAWHTKKGYRDTVVNVSSIYSAYTGYDTPEKIRNFIIDAKNTWGTMYVLLGGKGDAMGSARNYVPCRKGWYVYEGGVDNDSIPSDWYYADLDGNWDANGNHIYGELADNVNMYSDVFVGRAPVTSVAGAQNFVAKTLTYEKNPPAGYLKKMLLPTGILWPWYEERPTQRAIAAMTPAGWLDDSLFERNDNLSKAIMVSHFNIGEGLGHWMGHGSANCIAYNGGSIEFYTSENADAATNGDRQGIAISNACMTGGMDLAPGGDCLAEHLINGVGGGCVGVIMNSRYGMGGEIVSGHSTIGTSEMIDTSFMCNLLRRNVLTQGQAIAQAKNSWVPYADSLYRYAMMRWCIYELNLLGDPALPVLTDEPVALTVSHPSTILIGPNNFAVTVIDPTMAAVRGALVCLMTESHDSYVYDTTDASGSVTLHPAPVAPGQVMYVTVTARNYKPCEGTAMVIAPSGPYVAHLKHTMSDAAGNNDGVANPGETIQLPTWVKNYGGAVAKGVVAMLQTASPDGKVTNGVYNYGTIAAGDSACYSDGFGVRVNQTDTNGMTIPLTLKCCDVNGSVWISDVPPVVVGTAVLAYEGRGINGNGRLDPGETAKIGASLRNNGFGYSYNTQVVLRCTDGRITVTDSTAVYGTINQSTIGNSGADSFEVAVGSIPPGTSVGFTLAMKSDGIPDRSYSWSETVGDQRYGPTPDNIAGRPLYYAVEDSDRVVRAPVYSWAEIRGIGTQLTTGPVGYDSTKHVALPFPFTWYGTEYTSLSACSNGWISFGSNSGLLCYNTTLPTTYFTNPTIFPLWDDLDAQTSTAPNSWLGYYNDATNHRFIVEYDSLIFRGSSNRIKFEIIYYDSITAQPYYDVMIQYNMLSDSGSSSIGFQRDSMTGCQLLYNGTYASTVVSPFTSGRAVRITMWPAPRPGIMKGVLGAMDELPGIYQFGQTFPNPMRNIVSIGYQLPKADQVEVTVYNIAGQKVRTLVSGAKPAGYHTVRWDGRDETGKAVAAGVYLYRLTTPDYARTGKLSFVK